MVKRSIVISNPAYLSTENQQFVITHPESKEQTSLPIEDLGMVILENRQITLSHSLLVRLAANNTVVVPCDEAHLPVGYLLPLAGHHLATARMLKQLTVAKPLTKKLWQQTVRIKIRNQASVLEESGANTTNMRYWVRQVKSGDTTNVEAKAAKYYWQNLFPSLPDFTRNPEDEPPNQLLNYGYAILRAVVARAVVGAGLHPAFGIFHRNQYNPYCLADDLMEPYRPLVDRVVMEIVEHQDDYDRLTKANKKALLEVPSQDVILNGQRSPLLVAVQQTAASLARCYEGEQQVIEYGLVP